MRVAGGWLLLVLLGLAAPVFAGETDPVELVKQLSSEDFDTREQAARQLEELGEKALPALELAVKSADPDVRELGNRLRAKFNLASLQILAFDRNGKPAADAEATVQINAYHAQEEQGPRSVKFGADGSGRLTELKLGQVYGTLQIKDWVQLSAWGNTQFNFSLHSGINPMVVTLSRGGKIEGVIAGPDGKPVKDAKLVIQQRYAPVDPEFIDYAKLDFANENDGGNWSGRRLSEVSGTDGKVVLDKVTDGVYQTYVVHELFCGIAGPVVRVREGAVVTLPELKFATARKEVKLEIVLQDEFGKPMKQRQVYYSIEPVLETAEAKERWKKMQTSIRQFFWNDSNNLVTDDTGKFTLDKQPSGRHQLRITSQQNGRFFGGGVFSGQEELEAIEYVHELNETGEKPVVQLTLKPVTGASLKGKILSSEGKPVENTQVALYREEEFVKTNVLTSQWTGWSDDYPEFNRNVSTKKTGEYEFKNVPDGKFTLVVNAGTPRPVVVYGLTVKGKQTTPVPEIKLPGDEKRISARDIKGKVLLPDGSGGGGANIMLSGKQNSWSSSVQADGSFDFGAWSNDAIWTAERLAVRLKGYKPVTVNLQDPKTDTRNLLIKLEKIGSGQLRVVVTDEAGKPVAGAKVYPKWNEQYRYWYADPSQKRFDKASVEGVATFKTVAAGKRKVFAECDGYYAEGKGVDVLIEENKEAEIKIVMRKGLSIEVQAQAAGGGKIQNAVVSLTGNQGYANNYLLGADGKYTLTGLAPGSYHVNVTAPGMSANKYQQIELKADQPAAVAKFELTPHAFASVTLPRDFTGSLSLVRQGTWNPLKAMTYPQEGLVSTLTDAQPDADGRYEFGLVPPGVYDVLAADYDQFGGYNQSQLAGSRVVGQLEAKAVPLAELPKLPAPPLQISSESGSVKMHFKPPEMPKLANPQARCNVTISIVGEKAVATGYLNQPGSIPELKPVEIGTPPEGFKLSVGAVGGHSAKLPPGTYKIYVRTQWWGRYGNVGDIKKDEELKPIKEFALKAGETLDLGTIEYVLDAPPKELVTGDDDGDDMNWNGQNDDEINVFKP